MRTLAGHRAQWNTACSGLKRRRSEAKRAWWRRQVLWSSRMSHTRDPALTQAHRVVHTHSSTCSLAHPRHPPTRHHMHPQFLSVCPCSHAATSNPTQLYLIAIPLPRRPAQSLLCRAIVYADGALAREHRPLGARVSWNRHAHGTDWLYLPAKNRYRAGTRRNCIDRVSHVYRSSSCQVLTDFSRRSGPHSAPLRHWLPRHTGACSTTSRSYRGVKAYSESHRVVPRSHRGALDSIIRCHL
ncbi:hypothetical protein FA95DRAFT_1340472 [Auriscalpium vulgare]|uniref:Uncharacterized protein n=1 Tax=Auriscalpium vulgare TaxID=40419 RepID=A0ACB8RSG0_9AGAM|nr:hypothetical protein FA95DRAFT_1340472 [Auriscalpium vulgare]